MTIPVYNTGTVSVAANGTVVSGGGTTIWGNNVREGDWIVIDGLAITMVLQVTDDDHLVIPEWKFGAKTAVTYAIYQNYSARDDSSAIAKDVGKFVAAFNKEGFIWFVGPGETEPDPSNGDEGQFAWQPITKKQWHKEGGLWLFDGIFAALGIPAPYDNGKTYSLNDVATSGGSSFVWINTTPGSGHPPPNATYWTVLAAKGDQGAQGPQGNPGIDAKQYGGTSTSSLTIGTGAKAFTTQAGLAYTSGARVRASSSANAANWMEGVATYSGSTLTITVDKTSGSGTIASWNFNIAGQPGAGDLSSANNLSDLQSVVSARLNLGIDPASLTKSANFTAIVTNYGALFKLSGSGTMTMTAAATLGDGWKCDVRNTSSGVWVIDPNGSELINGFATFSVFPGENFRIVCDGAGFYTVGTSSGLVLMDTKTGTNIASFDFTRFDSNRFAKYEYVFEGVYPNTSGSGLALRCSSDGGATYVTTSSYIRAIHYAVNAGTVGAVEDSTAQNFLALGTSSGNTSGFGVFGKLNMTSLPTTFFDGNYVGTDSGGTRRLIHFFGLFGGAANAVSFFMTGSTNISGTIRQYGVTK